MKARYLVAISSFVFICASAAFITIAYYFLYTPNREEDKKHSDYEYEIPDLISAGIYVGLSAASLLCTFFKQINNYRLSYVIIIVLSLCRAAQLSLYVVDQYLLHLVFYILSFVMEILLLIQIPNEYFIVPSTITTEQMANMYPDKNYNFKNSEEQYKNEDEYYFIDDPALLPPPFPPSLDQLESTQTSFSPSHSSSKKFRKSWASYERLLSGQNNEKKSEEKGMLNVELVMALLVVVCALLVVALYILEGGPSKTTSHSVVTLSFDLKFAALGCTSFFPLVLIPVQILKVKKAVMAGAELVACNHSNGLAFLLLAGGFTLHFIFSCAFTLAVGLGFVEHDQSTAVSSAIFGVDILTVVLPLCFHLFNSIKSSSETFVCDVVARTRAISYTIAMLLHAAMLAVALPASITSYSDLDAWSTAAATIATLDFLFLLSSSLSPLFQLLYQTAMRQSVHNLHLHRVVAILGASFTLLHIILSSIKMKSENEKTKGEILQIFFGAFAAFLFSFSGIGGFVASKLRYHLAPSFYRFLRLLHIPCTIFGIACLFVHQPNKGLENFLFISFMLSGLLFLILYSTFLVFNPIDSAKIDLAETEWGSKNSKQVFLVANYNKPTPPGAYFLLYPNTKNHLDYFHARPAHVFSSKNRKLSFLVESTSDSGRNLLFSHYLSSGKHETLLLQGPFVDGTVNAFMDYIRSAPVDIDVYLCGWDSGFAKIFSILENLKEIWPFTNIRRICCMFNVISDKAVSDRVHTFLNRLVKNWKSTIPVTIVETITADLRNMEIMSERVYFNTKASTIDFFRESATQTHTPSPPSLPSSSSSPPSLTSSSSSSSTSSHRSLRFPLLTRARWVVMRDEQDFADVNPAYGISNPFRNRVLYFCGDQFQPKLFRGWKYFVESL